MIMELTDIGSWGFLLRSKKCGDTRLTVDIGRRRYIFKWNNGWVKAKLTTFKDIMGKETTELINREYGIRLFTRPHWDALTLMVTHGIQLPNGCTELKDKFGSQNFYSAPWHDFNYQGLHYHDLGMHKLREGKRVYSIVVKYEDTDVRLRTEFSILTRTWTKGRGKYSFLKYITKPVTRTSVDIVQQVGTQVEHEENHELEVSASLTDPLHTIQEWCVARNMICDLNSVKLVRS